MAIPDIDAFSATHGKMALDSNTVVAVASPSKIDKTELFPSGGGAAGEYYRLRVVVREIGSATLMFNETDTPELLDLEVGSPITSVLNVYPTSTPIKTDGSVAEYLYVESIA
ncbi:MAG: hypothetical protein WA919_26380 [Coleofasciculaceae cyanobacterium]